MRRLILLLTALGLMACNPGKATDNDPMIFLENESLKAGFLPGVGGRLVFLGRPGSENLLKSDSTLWREAASDRINPSPQSEWKAYNGHIIWIGPQSEWWTHQDLNEQRKSSEAVWPPDPYLIYSTYKVDELSENSLILEGPPSPVSGVQLTKKYSLSESGLEVEVTMSNCSKLPVSWDIWSNARFEGSTLFFIPACENGILRISMDESGKTAGFEGEIVESAFTFVKAALGAGENRRYAKAFLHPDEGKIVAVGKGAMLVMFFDFVARDKVHPEQGFVEVYKSLSATGADDLLELEHHSAYVLLQPGESHVLRERWQIYDYPGALEPEEAVKWYNKLNK